tara:strand:+ start:1932 stop:2345 length:414 start_codon:yes stop_codon:yes gene_type:complete
MKENDEYYQRSGFALPKYIYLYSFDILKMNLKISLFHNSLCYVDEQIAESFIEKINSEKDLLEIGLNVLQIVPKESDEYSRDDYYNVWFDKLEGKHNMKDCEMNDFVKEYLEYVFDKRSPEFEVDKTGHRGLHKAKE